MTPFGRRRWSRIGAMAGAAVCAVAGFESLEARADQPDARAALKRDFERPMERPQPKGSAASPVQVALGRQLFFDTRLSGSGRTSCASCHDPAKAWGDGRPRGVGDTGQVLPRRSPTIVDAAWGGPYFWDGRADSLEDQAKGPIGSPAEMNIGHVKAQVVVTSIPAYRAAFAKAYPGEPVTIDLIARAIAAFERTVVSPKAPFDRWIAGDERAVSAEAKRGFDLFNGKANCASCHSGWRFTDDGFHDIGLETSDAGRAAIKPNNPLMRHAMKTPTLRNVARRAPYMHNGSIPTLEAVVAQYDRGGLDRPSRSPEVRPLALTPDERRALVAFMRTLTTPTPTSRQIAQFR